MFQKYIQAPAVHAYLPHSHISNLTCMQRNIGTFLKVQTAVEYHTFQCSDRNGSYCTLMYIIVKCILFAVDTILLCSGANINRLCDEGGGSEGERKREGLMEGGRGERERKREKRRDGGEGGEGRKEGEGERGME